MQFCPTSRYMVRSSFVVMGFVVVGLVMAEGALRNWEVVDRLYDPSVVRSGTGPSTPPQPPNP